MPTRLYRPVREKLTTLDHVMAHEAKFSLVAGIWTTLGLVLCWTWIDPGGGPATVLSRLHPWAAGGVAVALLVSGLLVCAAIVWRDDRVAWRLELTALPLGASAWIAYAAVSPSIFWRIIAAGYVTFVALRLLDAWLTLRRGAPPSRAAVSVTTE